MFYVWMICFSVWLEYSLQNLVSGWLSGSGWGLEVKSSSGTRTWLYPDICWKLRCPWRQLAPNKILCDYWLYRRKVLCQCGGCKLGIVREREVAKVWCRLGSLHEIPLKLWKFGSFSGTITFLNNHRWQVSENTNFLRTPCCWRNCKLGLLG